MGEAKRRRVSDAGGLRRLRVRAGLPAISKLLIPAGSGVPSQEFAAQAIAAAETTRRLTREALVAASALGTRDALSDAIDAAGAQTVAAFEAAMSGALAEASTRRAEMAAVECRRGCAFCCHLAVEATPIEVIRLYAAMRRGTIPDRKEAILAAATQSPRATPCPLLVEDACSAYALRPFACRSLYSRSVKRCEDGFNGIDLRGAGTATLGWPQFLTIGYVTGEVAALRDLGLPGHLVELKAALALLFRDETALRRWYEGNDVFPRRIAAAS